MSSYFVSHFVTRVRAEFKEFGGLNDAGSGFMELQIQKSWKHNVIKSFIITRLIINKDGPNHTIIIQLIQII